jgi:DNA polymerase-3 subunit epsilon
MKFTCLDFETANFSDASICAAGVAVFVDGVLTESRHWLVRPPVGHDIFLEDFIEIHGIRPSDVQDEPEFPAVAEELLPFLTGADVVVAHNAQFDMRMLKGTLNHFGIPCPILPTLCTRHAARCAWPDLRSHSLDIVAAHVGHMFQHHNAREDAEAAGRVLAAIIEERGDDWILEGNPKPLHLSGTFF